MLVVFKTNQKDYEMILFKTHSTQAAFIYYVVSPPSDVSKKKLTFLSFLRKPEAALALKKVIDELRSVEQAVA